MDLIDDEQLISSEWIAISLISQTQIIESQS